MTEALEFLQDVLPTDGYYCLAKPYPKGGYGHQTFATVEELANAAEFHSRSETDIFFAVGSLKERFQIGEDGKKHVRTHDNILNHKSLFVDLDCGSTKDYPTQIDAIKALKSFCEDSGWFKPTYVISSGKGIHVYWVFTKQLPSDQWKQLADRFKAITKHFGLKADPVCTSDKARVLRVPGTFNWKNPDDPKPVKVLRKDAKIPALTIQDKIKSILKEHQIEFKKPREEQPEVPEFLKEIFAEKASNLAQVSEVSILPIYENCQQMAWVRDTGGPAGYGARTCAVSIIKLTIEKDYDVLLQNDPNPDLVEAQTEAMLRDSVTNNPSTCDRFASFNPTGCDGCQFKGKIKSPIVLGKRIKSVYDEPIAPPEQTITEITETYQAEETEKQPTIEKVARGKVYKAFAPPAPYVHTKDHRVFVKQVNDGLEVDVEVCDFMLIPIEVGIDHTKKASASVKLYIKNGRDDARVLDCPMCDVISNDNFRKFLSGNGILDKNTEKSGALTKYMVAYIKHIQAQMKSVETHGALGWDGDDHQKFIMPAGIYDREGKMAASSTSASVDTAMTAFAKKGSLEEWKSVVNTYARKGYEDYAFAHLVGYGSIVFSVSGYSGAIVSMVGNSGSGKSTVLETINSVYGKPKNYLNQADTMNAKMNRLSIYKNIPVTYDEITNMPHDELSQFVYSVSQGRSKLRLDQNGNEKDSTNNSWQMILACTSNSNLVDKLSAYKQDASAESMRIFEFYINRREDMTYDVARKIFDKLGDNYGHAGDIFLSEFMKKLDKVKELYDSLVTRLSQDLNASSKERYWIAVAASVIAGGIISQKLGLHDFNMENIYAWAVKQINNMRGLVQDNVKTPQATLVDFLNSILNRTLVVAGGITEKNKITSMYPLIEPQDAVWARTEKDRNVMYVDQQKLRDYVTKGGSDFNNLKTALIREGIVLEVGVNKVLTRDSNKARTGNTRCWKIDLSHREMADAVITPSAPAKLEGTQVA